MRRREFITLLSGLVMWPLMVRAQQLPDRIRKIGVLMIIAEAEAHSEMRAFRQGLAQLGWEEGKNVKFEYRWAAGNSDRLRADAAQLANLTDLILAQGTPGLAAARNAAPSLPIVFVNVTDPVAQGFVQSLAHPGGNITGFALLEESMGAKWLEVLKELAPETKRVALMFNPAMAPYYGMYFQSIEAAARRRNATLRAAGSCRSRHFARAHHSSGRAKRRRDRSPGCLYASASRSHYFKGRRVFIPGATRDSDGAFKADRITVGKDGVAPPM